MKLEFSDRAKADLKSISEFTLRKWGAKQQRRYSKLMREAFKRIRRNPAIARIRDDIGHAYRSLPIGRHTVFFKVSNERIDVIRVLHSHMDAAAHLRTDNEVE